MKWLDIWTDLNNWEQLGDDVDGGGGMRRVPLAGAAPAPVAAAAAAKPPLGNTGARLNWDFGDFSFPSELCAVVESMVTHLLGHAPVERPGLNYYRCAKQWEAGAILAWSPAGAVNGHRSWLSLNSESLSRIPVDKQFRLMLDLQEIGATCSRLDICFDDFTKKLVDIDKIEAAGRAYNYAGPRTFDPRAPRRGYEAEGRTMYFGSSQSETRVRAYEKWAESKGKIDSNRYEAQWRGDHAKRRFEVLTRENFDGYSDENLAKWQDKMGQLLGSAMRFVDRRPELHGHVADMDDLDWFAELKRVIGCTKIVVQKAQAPFQKRLKTFVKQYGKFLGTAFNVLRSQGQDFVLLLDDVVQAGARQTREVSREIAKLGVDWDDVIGRVALELR